MPQHADQQAYYCPYQKIIFTCTIVITIYSNITGDDIELTSLGSCIPVRLFWLPASWVEPTN